MMPNESREKSLHVTTAGKPCDWNKYDYNLNYIWSHIRNGEAGPAKVSNLISTSGLCVSDQSLLWDELTNLICSGGARTESNIVRF